MFLEEQAIEREQERDEFVKEIQRLKTQLREKDKDKVSFERATKEVRVIWFGRYIYPLTYTYISHQHCCKVFSRHACTGTFNESAILN